MHTIAEVHTHTNDRPVLADPSHAEQWLADYLLPRLSNAAQILEVGCGDGLATRRVAEQWTGAWIVGLEQDYHFFAQARSNVNSLTNALATHGNPGDMPFASDEFDVAFTRLRFSDPTHRQRVLAEMTRVVRRGGMIVVCNDSPIDFEVT